MDSQEESDSCFAARELCYLGGMCASTKKGIERLLGRPGGVAAVLVVGGAREALIHSSER